MAGIRTKQRAWAGAIILGLIAAAVLIKWLFFPPLKDAYFGIDDRSLLQAPPGLVVIRPTHFSFLRRHKDIDFACWPNHQDEWRAVGRDVPLRRAFAVAYDTDQFHVLLSPDAPTNGFDFLVTVSTNQEIQLQGAIRRTLGYTAHEETRNVPVLALVVTSPDLPGLKLTKSNSPYFPWGKMVDFPVRRLVWPLEMRLQQLVVDETGLTNRYDFDWDFRPRDRATLDKMLAHLGLGLEAKTEPIQVLVVDKAD